MKSCLANNENYEELIDEEGCYWIALGPRRINLSYSDDGDLRVGGKGNKRLEMRKYADVVIKRGAGPEVYLYCRIGEVRAHTWLDKGNKENGLSQTGYPYPNNASGKNQLRKVPMEVQWNLWEWKEIMET